MGKWYHTEGCVGEKRAAFLHGCRLPTGLSGYGYSVQEVQCKTEREREKREKRKRERSVAHPRLLQKTAFCFDHGAHLLWHCFDNLMQCHNIYFHPDLHTFLPEDFVLMTGESNHSFSLLQHIPKTFNGVKSGHCGGQFMCENYFSCSLTLMCPSCSTLSQLEPDESWHCPSWNMPEPSGKKKSFDGITWLFSTCRNAVNLQCRDLTN